MGVCPGDMVGKSLLEPGVLEGTRGTYYESMVEKSFPHQGISLPLILEEKCENGFM